MLGVYDKIKSESEKKSKEEYEEKIRLEYATKIKEEYEKKLREEYEKKLREECEKKLREEYQKKLTEEFEKKLTKECEQKLRLEYEEKFGKISKKLQEYESKNKMDVDNKSPNKIQYHTNGLDVNINVFNTKTLYVLFCIQCIYRGHAYNIFVKMEIILYVNSKIPKQRI